MKLNKNINNQTLISPLIMFSASGCSHNGTMFANGSFVPTVEPCLNCKCINTNLICALRVCPEQPIPPPRGCVVVQKRDSCCPYLTCSKYHTTSSKGEDNKKVVTYDRKWFEQNIKHRVFSQNSLLRRIDDDAEDESNRSHQFNNEKSKLGFPFLFFNTNFMDYFSSVSILLVI